MKCVSCGNENKNGAKFCAKCGTPLVAAVPVTAATSAETKAASRKNHKAIGVAAVVLVAILAVMLLGGSKTLDMSDYVTVTFNGKNGNGNANFSVDYDTLIEKVFDGREDEDVKNAALIIGSSGEYFMKLTKVQQAISFEMDQYRNLSNGDKVTISIKSNQVKCEELGIKVKNDTLTFKVKGLDE